MEFNARKRIELEEIEDRILAPWGIKSAGHNKTRQTEENEHDYRTNFQRDRDRIIHSRAFRRLKHKRQVFLTTTGDHYRTRLTHTLEVVQLSRTLARSLGVNEDLTEAIALGHDLGHTPFGHIGEVALDRILKGKDHLDGILDTQDYGGFKHNYQSVRIVDRLEKKYKFDGLNLTTVVREGILKHTRLILKHISYPDWQNDILKMEVQNSQSVEGQIVSICDEIAQRTHDLEDGLRAGFVNVKEVRKLPIVQLAENQQDLIEEFGGADVEYFNVLIKKLINLLVTDVISTTLENLQVYYERNETLLPFNVLLVNFSTGIYPLQAELDRFITRRIIRRPGIGWTDEMAIDVIRKLFKIYLKKPREMQSFPTHQFFSRYTSMPDAHLNPKLRDPVNDEFIRLIADYIAGMTDRFAMQEFERLVEK
ncbi:dNTP triphosphohydrolase [candidate division KSB1 bacterium]|nr:dNTP triphosphohydrolase [candidate division KSB1 bacterium]